jgi:serine acetyltransferase
MNSDLESWNPTQERERLIQKCYTYDQMSLLELIRSDMKHLGKKRRAFTKLGFYAAFFYRISRRLSLKNHLLLSSFTQLISHIITGAEISNKAIIGPALMILHPTALHIGPNVRIGADASLCECCAIFRNDGTSDGSPVIGDYLWASSGSKIIGSITLGDHVWVGPNSVIFKDVPSNMTAFGFPARILSKSFRKNFPSEP